MKLLRREAAAIRTETPAATHFITVEAVRALGASIPSRMCELFPDDRLTAETERLLASLPE